MGSCFSKKKDGSSSSSLSSSVAAVEIKKDSTSQKVQIESKIEKKIEQEPKKEDEGLVKKEVFVIKHRKSHDKRSIPQENEAVVNVDNGGGGQEIGTNTTTNTNNINMVRTSSCTKEEVDAILIQCGRLSRSNSSGKTGRKYSGSKRSYDFDHNDLDREAVVAADESDSKKKSSEDDDDQTADKRQHRQRHRQQGNGHGHSSPQGRRRRTPSRERDQQQQQRSGSRERGGGSTGRRVSRSPNRRSENNTVAANANTAGAAAGGNNRPGKMVSVPASVNSLVMDKSNNAEPTTNTTAIKRVTVKRNVASPRSQSPARANANNNVKGSNENNQQQASLSRSSSRKAEHSPYRRNPLSEIDTNSLAYPQSASNNNNNNNNKAPTTNTNRAQNRNREIEEAYQAPMQKQIVEAAVQGNSNNKTSSRGTLNSKVVVGGTNCTEKEQQQILETAVVAETQKLQTLTRTRSSRRSRDLDFNPETLLNPPTPSYTALLLEDIQSFHQKNTTNTTPPSFSLPPCVTKACSILEAVADLNSTTSSNLSCSFSEDRKSAQTGKKISEAKDPFVESEVLVDDDLTEPSFHKYVTVKRGGSTLDLDGQESSGSNSYVGTSQQNWNLSSSSWEPNSADSTDRWTSRSNNTREEDPSPLGFQRHALSESDKSRRGFSGKNDHQQTGIGRGRVGAGKGLQHHTISVVATAAST